jgi:hypothetical protein
MVLTPMHARLLLESVVFVEFLRFPLSGPLTRFTPDRIAAMAPALIAAGRNLSTALGGSWE